MKKHQKNCVFCAIVSGEQPCFKVWEDQKHLAFLSTFPNTSGVTVVITKKHQPSDVFSLSRQTCLNLVVAARIVAKHLSRFFRDAGRTGAIIEGFGVDHAHIKLYPMHGTEMRSWHPMLAERTYFCEQYEGFLTSQDGPKIDALKLARLAKKIRASIK